MKIAAKLCLAALAFGAVGSAWPVVAQTPAVSVPSSPVLPASPSPASSSSAGAPGIALPTLKDAATPASSTPLSSSNPSAKAEEETKGIIKRLDSVGDSTLEDLNTARESVAKLDILIDIEKRLTELANLRKEREKDTLSGAIPASALGLRSSLPPSMPAAVSSAPSAAIIPAVSHAAPAHSLPTSKIDVERIFGAAGRYVATVKVDGGSSKLVREGDKLSDGSVVQSISNQGVTLLKDSGKRTIQVKDILTVFSNRS